MDQIHELIGRSKSINLNTSITLYNWYGSTMIDHSSQFCRVSCVATMRNHTEAWLSRVGSHWQRLEQRSFCRSGLGTQLVNHGAAHCDGAMAQSLWEACSYVASMMRCSLQVHVQLFQLMFSFSLTMPSIPLFWMVGQHLGLLHSSASTPAAPAFEPVASNKSKDIKRYSLDCRSLLLLTPPYLQMSIPPEYIDGNHDYMLSWPLDGTLDLQGLGCSEEYLLPSSSWYLGCPFLLIIGVPALSEAIMISQQLTPTAPPSSGRSSRKTSTNLIHSPGHWGPCCLKCQRVCVCVQHQISIDIQ